MVESIRTVRPPLAFRRALVIGNSIYKETLRYLPHAEEDAKAIAAYLEKKL